MTDSVIYRFFSKPNDPTIVEMTFDHLTYHLQLPADANRPEWAKLNFQRCPNCSLDDAEAYCPAAVAIAQFLPKFEARISFEKVVVEVETPRRTIVKKTEMQHGIAGVMGLSMATSGCPHTAFLRPMARTHLPFATDEETVLRSLAFHLLTQFVEKHEPGQSVNVSLDALKENYGQLSIVNGAMAERMRAAITRDAAVNAVIILDSFAVITPENIDYGFEDIRPFFVS